MSWIERPKSAKPANPSKKFLEWSSEHKTFHYWDKEKGEKGERVYLELPLKFVILEHYHTITGFDQDENTGIYANEVFMIGQETLNVRRFKGQPVAEGLYKDIKNDVNKVGGRYARSIYAVTTDKELVNFKLMGSAVSSYYDFIDKFGDSNFDTRWIKVAKFEEGKKGAVKYTYPVFEPSTPIKDKSALQPFADELQEYILKYLEGDMVPKESEVDKYNASKESESYEEED